MLNMEFEIILYFYTQRIRFLKQRTHLLCISFIQHCSILVMMACQFLWVSSAQRSELQYWNDLLNTFLKLCVHVCMYELQWKVGFQLPQANRTTDGFSLFPYVIFGYLTLNWFAPFLVPWLSNIWHCAFIMKVNPEQRFERMEFIKCWFF